MAIALIIAIAIIIGLGIYSYRLRTKQLEVIKLNTDTIQQNELIQLKLAERQRELDRINETVEAQRAMVTALNETAEEMREGAQKRAQQLFEERKAEFDARLEEYQVSTSAELEKQIAAIVSRKEKEALQLKDLENKQLAYIQAQQRQAEIDSNQDYYRLVIDSIDLNDISLLRELQIRFFKKEAIDKLIWETYYKSAYDALMGRLFGTSTTKVSGIYKITDLTTGLAYIGQSVDVRERFRQHIKSSLAYSGATNRLYQTMQKSGQSNFTFEVLEQVPRDKLNEREVYWIDFYKTKEYGLNSTKGGA